MAAGLIVVPVVVPEVDVVEWLIAEGLLADAQRDDRQAIAAALGEAIRILSTVT